MYFFCSYSHGFLFPSEATRVRKSILSYFSSAAADLLGGEAAAPATPIPGDASSPSSWAYSSVSTFGVRYTPPVPDLTTLQSVEALVEGSEMSKLRGTVSSSTGPSDGSTGGLGDNTGNGNAGSSSPGLTPNDAWRLREGRRTRYEGARVGGTVAVHFIKKSPWFLETALALLEGDEQTPLEAGASLEQRLRTFRGVGMGAAHYVLPNTHGNVHRGGIGIGITNGTAAAATATGSTSTASGHERR